MPGAKDTKAQVHVISNYVTVNDVVNVILAAGAAAIGADDPHECAEITSFCDALLINTGTPNDRRIEAMLIAGRAANQKGIPVVLDPVGAGASRYRRELLTDLLAKVRFTVIRGNRSEIAELCRMTGSDDTESSDPGHPHLSRGVEDSGETVADPALLTFSKKTGAVLCLTGEKTELIAPSGITTVTEGGSPLQRSVTGSGCMMGGVIAAALAMADDPDRTAYETVCRAVNSYEKAARSAEERLSRNPEAGTGTYRIYLIDAICHSAFK